MTIGPNVKRLIAHKMAADAVPMGAGLSEALAFVANKDKIMQGSRKAIEWVEQALAVVRTAPDNTYATDEEIAREILRRIQKREAKP